MILICMFCFCFVIFELPLCICRLATATGADGQSAATKEQDNTPLLVPDALLNLVPESTKVQILAMSNQQLRACLKACGKGVGGVRSTLICSLIRHYGAPVDLAAGEEEDKSKPAADAGADAGVGA